MNKTIYAFIGVPIDLRQLDLKAFRASLVSKCAVIPEALKHGGSHFHERLGGLELFDQLAELGLNCFAAYRFAVMLTAAPMAHKVRVIAIAPFGETGGKVYALCGADG